MTIHLLDANVLIRAHADYYPIDRIETFWTWLLGMAEAGHVTMPAEIFEEVAGSEDLLGQWLRRPDVRRALVLPGAPDPAHVRRVIALGYAPDLNDIELVRVGRDPFLVAAALGLPDPVVVTREVARPRALRANRHLPDVCATLGVRCINDFELWRRLDFRIR